MLKKENKTLEVLYYIIKNFENSSVTSLMKLSYLIDLINYKNKNKQITDFSYYRYLFGPFDPKIYYYIQKLLKQRIIYEEPIYVGVTDTTIFKCNGKKMPIHLTTTEKDFILSVLKQLRGSTAKMLTEITYKTKPMEALGATLGGNENIYEKLDLSLVVNG